MTDEYWNYPLKGKNGRTENGSKKYRDYYFEHDGNISNQEIADYFGVSKSVIEGHKSNYDYDGVLADKKAYIQHEREKKREEAYQEFIDHDLKNAKTQITALYSLSQIALIYLGLLPDNGQLDIPEDMTIKEATRILQNNPAAINRMHNQVLRDLEKAPAINDKQTHNINGNMELSQVVKIDDTDVLDDLFTKLESGDNGGNETE